jgi:dihydrofolate reductase
MRKLKLQMQLTVDGYVAGPNGKMDWMTQGMDKDLMNLIMQIHEPVDCIILGRKLAEGFIPYWTAAVADPKTDNAFARKMVDTPKVVFTKTLERSAWANTVLAKGDLVEEVTKLKQQPGGDIIVYGGASFVSDLIKHNMIDEMYLAVNPVAIGKGMSIFNERTYLTLVTATPYSTGEVVLQYQPSK